jgi:uncharacterized membrane protein
MATTVLLFRAKSKRDFTWASMLVKLVMFAGILLLLRSWPDDPAVVLDQARDFVSTRW